MSTPARVLEARSAGCMREALARKATVKIGVERGAHAGLAVARGDADRVDEVRGAELRDVDLRVDELLDEVPPFRERVGRPVPRHEIARDRVFYSGDGKVA